MQVSITRFSLSYLLEPSYATNIFSLTLLLLYNLIRLYIAFLNMILFEFINYKVFWRAISMLNARIGQVGFLLGLCILFTRFYHSFSFTIVTCVQLNSLITHVSVGWKLVGHGSSLWLLSYSFPAREVPSKAVAKPVVFTTSGIRKLCFQYLEPCLHLPFNIGLMLNFDQQVWS